MIVADYTIQTNTGDVVVTVDIAEHCDKTKLAIAEVNAMDYDLASVLCDLDCYFKEGEVPEDDPIYIGGTIKHFKFRGLNGLLGLYSYARYVENSIYVDTGSGFVRKDHSNSFPIQKSELTDIALQHRTMAKIEVERLMAYACSNSKCNCICSGSLCDKSKLNSRLSRSRGRNVSRR